MPCITASALSTAGHFADMGRDVTKWIGMYTIPFNVTGNPALSVPSGLCRQWHADGLPDRRQTFDEATAFRIGAAYEAAAGWTQIRPDIQKRLAA